MPMRSFLVCFICGINQYNINNMQINYMDVVFAINNQHNFKLLSMSVVSHIIVLCSQKYIVVYRRPTTPLFTCNNLPEIMYLIHGNINIKIILSNRCHYKSRLHTSRIKLYVLDWQLATYLLLHDHLSKL